MRVILKNVVIGIEISWWLELNLGWSNIFLCNKWRRGCGESEFVIKCSEIDDGVGISGGTIIGVKTAR